MSPSLQLVPQPTDPPPEAPALGIDLGTTHCLVAVLGEDGARLLTDGTGRRMLPSAVALDESGELLVGEAALHRLQRAPDAGVRWFKRDMGTSRVHALGPHRLTPTALSALLLRQLRSWACDALGQRPSRAVITVPAWFQEPQRAATRQAAELAGLEVLRLVNEPTAAALAHGLHDRWTERTCVVVDLGGGTLDVSVLELFEGVIEVVASGGDCRLGGEDFTDRLFEDAHREAGLPPGMSGPVPALLRAECERAKCRLSDRERLRLRLPSPRRADRWEEGGELFLSRARFAELCAPLLSRIRQCIRDTLAAAHTPPDRVDEVLLVGGATRMPALREQVLQLFGRPPRAHLDPDTTVARGAALQAGLSTRAASVGDLVVTDVLTHSLGIRVAWTGDDPLAGYFQPVLPRNTTLPARRVQRVQTVHPQQEQLQVDVYQGEHRLVAHNRLLGSLVVTGLPRGEHPDHRESVELCFAQDLDGLLTVEATVVSTGETASLFIGERAGRLVPAELEAAHGALSRLAPSPRELLPNRRLLERAHTLRLRLSSEQWHGLAPLLRAFEEALQESDRAQLATAAQQLEGALDRVDALPKRPS